MCIITDQLLQFHRAAKIQPPGALEEDQELDEDSQTLKDNITPKNEENLWIFDQDHYDMEECVSSDLVFLMFIACIFKLKNTV